MKILLMGEYNSSHQTLKEGLVELGHEVTVVGLGDGFKKRVSDINFTSKFKDGIGLFINKISFKLFKIDLHSISIKKQFFKKKHLFKGHDVVQLINECSLMTQPKTEKILVDYLYKNNKNIFLLSCGADHISIKYAHEDIPRYSILTPYKTEESLKNNLAYFYKYLLPEFVDLHHFVYDRIKGVIASDLDYHFPLLNHPKYLGVAPNPINLDEIKYIAPKIEDKIIIFHGINRANYYKKGSNIFEKALKIISSKFSEKIKIITVEDVPYKEYITLFDDAHILLDQVYAFDQGFNALEAMAKGKVVFTGAEKEWLDYYDLKEDTIAINALPNPNEIASKLEWLILNPSKVISISKNARQFIENHHSHVYSAQDYLNKWSSKI